MNTPTTHDRILAMMIAGHLQHGSDIVAASAATHVPLAVCCALVEQESAGRNVFGADPGGTACPREWWEGEVTPARYHTYRTNYTAGRGGPQGVGPCQLTDNTLQVNADKLGGCWVPRWNLQEGFTYIHALISTAGSVQLGLQHYNGSGPAAVAYGERVAASAKVWQDRINVALA